MLTSTHEISKILQRLLTFFSIAFLNTGKVGYDGDSVVESAWTTTAYSCDMLYTCTYRPVVSNPKRTRKKVRLWAANSGGRLCS